MNATLTANSATLAPQSAMRFGRLLRAYLQETRYVMLHALRAPVFTVPFLLMPGPFYLFFGVVMAGGSPQVRANPDIANYIYSGWAAFAVMGPAIFGIGCGLAIERDLGLMKLKRALPTPTGSYLAAKMVMSVVFAAIGAGGVAICAAFAGQITLTSWELLAHVGAMTLGALPFCAIGLFIGAYCSGSASPAIANLVYLPGLWLSGLFFPLPEVIRSWAVIWPSFHLNQVALAAAGVDKFRAFDPLMSLVVLIGVTVLFGGLALRRLARVG